MSHYLIFWKLKTFWLLCLIKRSSWNTTPPHCHFHILLCMGQVRIFEKEFIVLLPPFISFYSFPRPQLLRLIPAGSYIHCKHIINFFQIWNWVKIFHSLLNVSFDSQPLKIISFNHLKLVSLSRGGSFWKIKSKSFIIKIFLSAGEGFPFPNRLPPVSSPFETPANILMQIFK